jgi:hypothetical protein
VCEPDKPRMLEVTEPDRDLSVDRSFLLRPGEAEQSSVAVARRDYIQPIDDSAVPDRAAIFVPAAQTAETA